MDKPIPFPPADPHLTPLQQAARDLPYFRANGFKSSMELRAAEDSLDPVLFSPAERKVIVRRWRECRGRWTLQQVADAYEQNALMEADLRREDPFYDLAE